MGLLTYLLTGPIRAYQYLISPLLPPSCLPAFMAACQTRAAARAARLAEGRDRAQHSPEQCGRVTHVVVFRDHIE